MQHLPGFEDMRHYRDIGAFGGPGSCLICGRQAAGGQGQVNRGGTWYHNNCIRVFVRLMGQSWRRSDPRSYEKMRETLREYFGVSFRQ